MAVLATVMGFTGAFVLSFPAARNLVRNGAALWITRRLLEVMRSIPQVVLAFILVWPFGIGPLAGILAIGIHSTGALGKLFSEVNENADMRPVEGMRAAGGNWLEAVRYGMVPQVLPGFLSYALLRFEINVRSSTIIGFVGAGGIGQEFKRVIGFNIYEEVSAIAILILIIVMLIDLASEQIRARVIGNLLRLTMSGAIRLADITDADIGAARSRSPRAFARPWPRARHSRWRWPSPSWAGSAICTGCSTFGKIFSGLDRLWVIVGLMVDWSALRDWDHAEILKSMLETVRWLSWARCSRRWSPCRSASSARAM